MVVQGVVVGYQVFQSGACQVFVSSPANSTEKVREFGNVVRSFWRAKGTYDFNNPPDLIGASVLAFVGKNENGILELTPKGGDK